MPIVYIRKQASERVYIILATILNSLNSVGTSKYTGATNCNLEKSVLIHLNLATLDKSQQWIMILMINNKAPRKQIAAKFIC